MGVELSINAIVEQVASYIWPFVRISAFVMVMPLIGGVFVPNRVRLLLALSLTIVIAPALPAHPEIDVLSVAGALAVFREVAIGVLLGFTVQLVFDAITLGGQVIAMSMGLGFAVFLDHARGVNIPVLGQLFLLLAMLVFLSLNGHLALVRLLAESYQLAPIGRAGLDSAALGGFLEWSGQIFEVAIKIALPAVVALIVVNLSFGVMSRAAPTLNLFAVGFPAAMLLGFLVVYLCIGSLQENVAGSLARTLTVLPRLIGG